MRPVPDTAIELIKRFEGFSRKPYICPAGIPTIGYGSTRYESGKRVTMADQPITQGEAQELLDIEASKYGAAVLKMVRVALTDGQYGALVSFTYNLGSGRLKASTLLRKLNKGDYVGAAREFPKWCFAGKKKLRGLEIRRKAEQQLFMR